MSKAMFVAEISHSPAFRNHWRFVLIGLIILILASCTGEREYTNPYDPAVSPDSWAPGSLKAEATGPNSVKLTWEPKTRNIDGYILSRTISGTSVEIQLGKDAREYLDNTVVASGQPCSAVSYSLKAKAGNLSSSSAVLAPPGKFPLLTTAEAGPDIQGGTLTVTLNANAANLLETASWSVITGDGAVLSDIKNPKALFTGLPYVDYQLRWTINGVCGQTQDDVLVLIRPLPVVETGTGQSTGGTTATVAGNVKSDGGSAVTARGVAYGIQPSPVISGGIVASGTGTGIFTANLTGLALGTKYYARAFATNLGGTSYGAEVSFTTWNAPTVSTTVASSVLAYSAIVGGSVTSDGQAGVTERGVVWSTSQNPTTASNKATSGSGTGNFSVTLNSLTPKTVYYARAFAVNAIGTAYGNQVTFTTTEPQPVLVSTNNCSSLTGYTASFVYWTGTAYAWAPWTVTSSGYSGACFKAQNPNAGNALGGYVEFSRNFTNPGFIRFWIKTFNAGYNNRVPSIYVDGSLVGSPTLTAGNESSAYWMQLKTVDIPAGTRTIRLEWSRVGQFYDYLLDEIEYWEYR